MINPLATGLELEKEKPIIKLSDLPYICLHDCFEGRQTKTSVVKGFPKNPAIYFVESLSDFLYVGQTSSLFWRMKMHSKWTHFKEFSFVKVYWLEACGVDDLDRRDLERQLIRILRPRLNKLGVWHGRSGTTKPQYQLYGKALETLSRLLTALELTLEDVGINHE